MADVLYVVLTVATFALSVYLIIALVKPERF
jgi:K+-transporting ATPase KdpF subunit